MLLLNIYNGTFLPKGCTKLWSSKSCNIL